MASACGRTNRKPSKATATKSSYDGTKLANHHSLLRECQGQVCQLSFNVSVGLEGRGPSPLAATFRAATARQTSGWLFAAPDRGQNPVSLLGLLTTSAVVLFLPLGG